MNTEKEFYNVTPEPDAESAEATPTPPQQVAAPSAPQPLSPADERTWAMLAHLSVLLNLVTGFLGVGAALLIYLIYKDRSRYVAYQAMQAFLFQLLFWVGTFVLGGVMWAIVGALIPVVIGFFLIPIALLLTLALLIPLLIALGYGIYGSIETSNGKDFRYWLVSDWALNLM